MGIDRLSDLRDSDYEDDGDTEHAGVVRGGVPRVETGADAASDAFMSDFFDAVNGIKGTMATIKYNIDAVEDNFGEYIAAVTAQQAGEASEELDRLISETNSEKARVQRQLDEMRTSTAELIESGAIPEGSAEARMRENMLATLAKKFVELMRHYEEVQTDYKNKQREKVERRIRTVNPNATLEEIEEAISSGKASKVISQQLLGDTRYQKEAEEALSYVESKHREVQRLEASIEELHQLFIDMAILVEEQGQLFDQIEHNINKARDYTEQGAKQLVKAKKTQRKNRKKMIILFIVLFLVLGGILIPVILDNLPQ
uniref:t-SNARE coiled-coil homology domain-containing protein n=1 Tax=Sexangularia sp. CB-2014 TaxID=1486929 RepID=A0A6U0IXN1_9EUKA|mmetsp:Transcript_3762/g.12181  ORF Transcript_3762/g.12181 Transcript_3762/m.12181 type:complete len:315 (+) Transcript_3762:140-1084(+)